MNTRPKTNIAPSRSAGKNLTLGDLIIATYSACGEQRAPQIVQLAIDSHLVRFEKAVRVNFAESMSANKSTINQKLGPDFYE